MPTGFQTGARPAKTYILPPAAAPDISSAGCGNGASFTHLPCAHAKVAAKTRPTPSRTRCRLRQLLNQNIVPPLSTRELTRAHLLGRQPRYSTTLRKEASAV